MKSRLTALWDSPTFTSWASLAVRFSSIVLLLPVVLVRFSPEQVAVWQLFSALFVLGLMLDYALAPTFSRLLSYARAGVAVEHMGRVSGETQPLGPQSAEAVARQALTSSQAIFSTMRWAYPRLALGITIVMALVGTWSLYRPILELSTQSTAWLAWALVVVTLFFSVWGGCYSSGLLGMNRIAPMRRWDIVFGAAQVASSLLVLGLGGDLLALVATYQVWAVIGVIRNKMLLRRFHAELFELPAAFRSTVYSVAAPAAWRSLVSVFSSHGLIQLSGVLYGQAVPAADLASYLLALRLITVVSQFSQAPFYTKLPGLAQLHAAGQRAELLQVAGRGMRLAHWVFVGGALGAAFASPLLLQALHSRTQFVSPSVFAVLALAFFVERFGAMHIQLYSLTNHIISHYANGATGVLMGVGCLLLLPSLGLLAFPVAMLFGYALLYCPIALFHSNRAFPQGFIRFELKTSAIPSGVLMSGLAASTLLLR